MNRSPTDSAADPPGASADFVREVSRGQRRLYAFILTLLRSPADAEDVLQETNLVLWRKSGEFTPGTDFMAWALSVARFQVMAHLKRRQRTREHFDPELIAQLAEEAADRLQPFDDRRRALLHCLDRLDPQRRAWIAERYQPGGSVQALAERVGRTPKAMSEALGRIRDGLLRCIEQTLKEEAAG